MSDESIFINKLGKCSARSDALQREYNSAVNNAKPRRWTNVLADVMSLTFLEHSR